MADVMRSDVTGATIHGIHSFQVSQTFRAYM
jgi:hypothetical protein